MKANVSDLPVGTKFTYKGLVYEITNREDWPFVEAKCLTEPNDYEGLGVLFGGSAEIVEVAEDTQIIKPQIKIYDNRITFRRR